MFKISVDLRKLKVLFLAEKSYKLPDADSYLSVVYFTVFLCSCYKDKITVRRCKQKRGIHVSRIVHGRLI